MKRDLDHRLPLDLYISSGVRAASMLGHTAAVTALTLDLHARGADSWVVGGLLFAATLPLVLFAPMAGNLVDRHDSRRLIVVSGLWQAAVYTLLAFVDQPFLILFLMILASMGTAVTTPLLMSLTPLMVPSGRLAAANGLQQGLVVAGIGSGPAISGMLFGLTGDAQAPLLLDVAVYLAITGISLLITTRRRPTPGAIRPRTLDGITVLFADRTVGAVVALAVLLILVLHTTHVAQVFLVRDTFGASALTFGLVQATHTVGFLVAAVVASRLSTVRRILPGVLIAATVLSMALFGISLARSLPATFPLVLLTGFGMTVVLVSVSTLLMLRTPEHMIGRALASFTGAHRAAALLAYGLGGWIVGLVPPTAVYALAGAGALIVMAATTPALRRAWSETVAQP
jgi:MFS family permease